jgi:hypothetical protein
VPVLRNVRERDARDLRAGLDRAIPPEELRGATITLSNFGMIGGLFANLIAFSRRSRSWGLAGSPRAWWRMRVSLRCGACSRSRSPSTIVQSPAAKWLAFSWRSNRISSSQRRPAPCRRSRAPPLWNRGLYYDFCWIADRSQCPPLRRMKVQISVASSVPPSTVRPLVRSTVSSLSA